MKCKICDKEYKGKNGLHTHISLSHDIDLESYKLKYYDGYAKEECLVCDQPIKSKQKLNKHIKKEHNLSKEKYHWKYKLGLKKPPICNADGCDKKRDFDQYAGYKSTCGSDKCIKNCQTTELHFKPGWKKGLTKEDHLGIVSQARKISNDNNPYHSLDKETKNKIKKAKLEARRLSKKEIESRLNNIENFKLLTNLDKYKNVDQKLKWECNKCGSTQKKRLRKAVASGIRCWECNPYRHEDEFKECLSEINTGKQLSKETREKISEARKVSIKEIAERLEGDDFSLVDKDLENTNSKVKLKCNDCDYIFDRFLHNQMSKHHKCPNCSPVGRSEGEEEVASWLETEGFEISRNNTSILSNSQEVDIYIPSHNVGIEYHGLYWHSEVHKPKKYHKNKQIEANDNGVKLLQFFSDQWKEKKDVCKSIILHELNSSPNIIYARDCEVVEFNKRKQYRDFFDDNHIQNSTNSSWAYGLLYDGELVSCMSVRKPIHYDADEIARFCNKKFHHIPGALSRLLSYVRSKSEEGMIVSYADLMHGTGQGYKKYGFEYSHDTVVNYWYTDGASRFSRYSFQATKDKSEKEIAKEMGVYRIYGAGNKLYKMENQ